MPENDSKYLGSSKHLIMWIKQNGAHSVKKEILSVFDSRKAAVAHEVMLHEQYDVSKNAEFFNKAKQKTTGFDTTGCFGPRNGIKHTEAAKQKNRIAHTGKPAWNKGVKMPPEFGMKISERQKGCAGVNAGKKFSDEWCKKLSASRTGVRSNTFTPWVLVDPSGNATTFTETTMKDYSVSKGFKHDAMRGLLRCTQKHGVVKRGAFKGYKVFKDIAAKGATDHVNN